MLWLAPLSTLARTHADVACPRPAPGSVVAEPADLESRDGVLRVDCPTEHFKQSVSKLVLEFAARPPAFPGCLGLVQAWEVGRRLELVIVDFGPEQRQVIESLSPLTWDVVGLNLEDAFVDYTRGPRRSLPVFGEEMPEGQPGTSDRGAA